jgi:hypothetical protein
VPAYQIAYANRVPAAVHVVEIRSLSAPVNRVTVCRLPVAGYGRLLAGRRWPAQDLPWCKDCLETAGHEADS